MQIMLHVVFINYFTHTRLVLLTFIIFTVYNTATVMEVIGRTSDDAVLMMYIRVTLRVYIIRYYVGHRLSDLYTYN